VSPAAAILLAALAATPPALERLADQVVADVQRASPEPPVAIAVQGPAAAQGAFASLVAAKLTAIRLAGVVVPDEASARSAGARTLMRIELSADANELAAGGDLFGLWRSFWAGRTPVRPAGPVAAIAEHTAADAETLAMFGRAPTVTPSQATSLATRVIGTVDGRPAAVIAGDLTGDGVDELVLLTDRAVIVLDAHGNELAREALDGLPRSRTPCRDPFGALALVGHPARVAAFSASRGEGQLLALDAAQHAFVEQERIDQPLLGRDPLTFAARFVPGENRFAGTALPGGLGALRGAFETVSLFGSDAAAVLADGTGLRLHAGRASSVRALGAATTLVDLDGDGAPELLTTSPERFPSPDAAYVVGSAWPSVPLAGRAVAATAAHLGADARQSAVLAVELNDGRTQLLAVEVAR
jgi:hypothetical protein